jgi:hypothetical protein
LFPNIKLDKRKGECIMEDQNVVIKLELNVNEVNVILRSLGKHPFEEIAALIQKIKGQGEAQLAELQATQAPAEPQAEEQQ